MVNFKKHLAVFESASDYEAFKSSEEFVTPNVSLCKDEYKLHYNAKEEDVYDPFNGHKYVDLGLPSGTLWASAPLTTVEGEPLYFHFGDTEDWTATQVQNGEKSFASDGSDYKWMENGSYTKYNETDDKVVLDLEDDAVHVHMGGDWHMPTTEQFEELINNTTVKYTTNSIGFPCHIFTSQLNGNSITIGWYGMALDNILANMSQGYHIMSNCILDYGYNGIFTLTNYPSTPSMSLNKREHGFMVIGVIG